MHRLACIELPVFPLQRLLQKRPEWSGFPVAVVEQDRANGVVRFVNQRARRAGVQIGQTHAQALSLTSKLHAGVISAEEERQAIASIVAYLREFSPEVESSAALPGVFWCNATGLERLFRTLREWGRAIGNGLKSRGWRSSVVIGHRRFGCYALAHTGALGVRVLGSLREEEMATKEIVLESLDVEPALRDRLMKLGIVTLGEFCALPATALGTALGTAAHALHGLATGTSWDPLQPESLRVPYEAVIALEPPARDSTRIVFAIRRSLDQMLATLAKRHRAVKSLVFDFKLDHSQQRKTELIRPAEPTLESRLLLSLLQMRLESSPPTIAVEEIVIRADDVPATRAQLSLFSEAPRRELQGANEALARIRADLGEASIVRAVLREGHLPEAQYRWEPLEQLAGAMPQRTGHKGLVRRVFEPAQTLHWNRHAGEQKAEARRVVGPHRIAGGWWNQDVHRDYYILRDEEGGWLWVYCDRLRRRWVLQGRVE